MLSPLEKKQLRNSGFLIWEIEQFDKGSVNFGSHTFQSAIRSRKLWVEAMRKVGWSDQLIGNRLRHWYKLKKGRNPFDWLKMEYKPPIKLTIQQLAKQLAIRRSVSRVLGSNYGRIRGKHHIASIGYKGIPKLK